MPVQLNSEPRPLVHMEGRQETPVGESCISFFICTLSTNKLILIAPCAILSSRKNNGGKHGNDKAENMGNNG